MHGLRLNACNEKYWYLGKEESDVVYGVEHQLSANSATYLEIISIHNISYRDFRTLYLLYMESSAGAKQGASVISKTVTV